MNFKQKSKVTLYSMLLSSILFSNLNADINNNYIDTLNPVQDVGHNYFKSNIVNFLLKNGTDYSERITDTQNLKLDAEKIYVENDKKAILIKVLNKTGISINVEAEIKEGRAFPKILKPHSIGYLVMSNRTLNNDVSYDTVSFNDRLVNTITTGNLSDISKYFYSDIEIYKYNGINANEVSIKEWNVNNINKTKMFIVDRIDRIIDEDSNRFGLFINGFIKVTNNFYLPESFYFIINQGKIVKIFEKEEYMKFDSLKNLLRQSAR